jgi:hypothetical protein
MPWRKARRIEWRSAEAAALIVWMSGCTPRMAIHPLQIVGENVKAYLSAYLFEGAQPEVGPSTP